jgi:hypothetical protein
MRNVAEVGSVWQLPSGAFRTPHPSKRCSELRPNMTISQKKKPGSTYSAAGGQPPDFRCATVAPARQVN